MWRQIFSKEISQNISTPKMAISAGVIILLLAINALVFNLHYNQKMTKYRQTVIENETALRENTSSLHTLLFFRQNLVKPPSRLAFIAEAEEAALPNGMFVNAFENGQPEYFKAQNRYFTGFHTVDWTFLIIYIMSFICLVFSYNAFSGEKERGALKLILSNPISRASLIFGKAAGIFICIIIPFILGIIINLIIISLNPSIQLGLREMIVVLYFLLTVIVFCILNILLGLLISTLTFKPVHSLNLTLIVWILLVIIIPSASWFFAREMIPVESEAVISEQVNEEFNEIRRSEPYTLRWNSSWAGQPPNDYVLRRAEGTQVANAHRVKKWHEYQMQRMAQTNLAVRLSKISPFAVFRFLGERLSDNGYFGFVRFYEQLRNYKESYTEFLHERDQQDPDSHHLIWYESWCSGTFCSNKPVPFESIPQFEYRIPDTTTAWQRIQWDFLILVFWCLALFAGTFVAFMRYDVR
jgi:ABC-type transport system involved in multi-copper enzyme maturation permease subunit